LAIPGVPVRGEMPEMPLFFYVMVKIEKIHGISVAIATVSPWISNK
jgi:hypothetical protein